MDSMSQNCPLRIKQEGFIACGMIGQYTLTHCSLHKLQNSIATQKGQVWGIVIRFYFVVKIFSYGIKSTKISCSNIVSARKIFVRIFHNAYRYCTFTRWSDSILVSYLFTATTFVTASRFLVSQATPLLARLLAFHFHGSWSYKCENTKKNFLNYWASQKFHTKIFSEKLRRRESALRCINTVHLTFLLVYTISLNVLLVTRTLMTVSWSV